MKRFLFVCISICFLFSRVGPADVVEAQTAPLESAKALYRLISQLYEEGQRDQARKLLKPFMIHLDDADRVVDRLYGEKRYAEAIPIAAGIIDLREKVLGPEHPETAAGLINLGSLYLKTGHFDRAEALYKTALQIREKTLGPEDLATAQCLTKLAVLYQAMQQAHQAEPLFKQALAIREKVLGRKHPETALGLNHLALLYEVLGEYDQCEPLLHMVLELRKNIFGLENAETIDSLINLGEFYQFTGEWEHAEPYLKQAVMAQEQLWGLDDPGTAAGMKNLAELYRVLGRYDEAESLLEKALVVQETSLGYAHLETAATLNQLGRLYKDAGQYDKSEPAFVRALKIREKFLGPDHPDVAAGLNNLGDLYRLQGDDELAEPLFKQALVVWEKTLGADHPNRAVAMNSLALLYKGRADYNQAEPLYKRALAVWEKSFGPGHPGVVVCLENLAALSVAKGNFVGAFEYQKKAQTVVDNLIELSQACSCDQRRWGYLSLQHKMAKQAIGLVSRYLADSAEARRDALDIWLKCKGITRKWPMGPGAPKESDQPKENDPYQELIKVRRSLARLTFGGSGKMSPNDYRDKITKLQARMKVLEQDPINRDPESGRPLHEDRADTEAVARALPEDAVLLDFARIGYDQLDPKALKNGQADHYLAFVVKPGEEPVVELVDLGPARPIDETITLLRKEIRKRSEAKAPSQSLYGRIFSKLKSQIGETKIVFVSPDSQLGLFPFELLQDPNGRYLIEDYTFNYLNSGGDMAGFGSPPKVAGSPVLLAAPDFDLASDALTAVLNRLALLPVEPFPRSRDLEGPFAPIPETSTDMGEIVTILNNPGTITHTGREAVEETVYWAKAPGILHIETHAFFLADQKAIPWTTVGPARLGIDINPDEALTGPPAAREDPRPENPTRRSGLALTGANTALNSDDLSQSQGILTSEKINNINLNGTDLVFLPMCETGLGEKPSGAAIGGLGEAFQQAGARAVIMSLWTVPKNERQALVTTFYKNLVQKRTPRRQALRDAILEALNNLKKRYGNNPPPIFWAAFIHLGEP